MVMSLILTEWLRNMEQWFPEVLWAQQAVRRRAFHGIRVYVLSPYALSLLKKDTLPVSPGKACLSKAHCWEAAVAVLAWPRTSKKRRMSDSHSTWPIKELKTSDTWVLSRVSLDPGSQVILSVNFSVCIVTFQNQQLLGLSKITWEPIWHPKKLKCFLQYALTRASLTKRYTVKFPIYLQLRQREEIHARNVTVMCNSCAWHGVSQSGFHDSYNYAKLCVPRNFPRKKWFYFHCILKVTICSSGFQAAEVSEYFSAYPGLYY